MCHLSKKKKPLKEYVRPSLVKIVNLWGKRRLVWWCGEEMRQERKFFIIFIYIFLPFIIFVPGKCITLSTKCL